LIILRTFEHHEPTLVKDWLSAMRCLVCNAEMVLMEAVLADPTILPGFEHRIFSCCVCRECTQARGCRGCLIFEFDFPVMTSAVSAASRGQMCER
jgi:hypothetical protein